VRLSQGVRTNVEIRDRAAPLLRMLADSTHLSVYLAIPEYAQVLYIYAVETSHRLMARTAVGEYAPMYCTSVGKSLLAWSPPAEQALAISAQTFEPFTNHTIRDAETLIADLHLAYERGYSLDNQEHELNIYCIGAPILDSHGSVIAACSVSGIDATIVGSECAALSAQVMQTAQEISRRMGYVPSRSVYQILRSSPRGSK
jgi:DNA-binding IclR family transcriptional regulator